MGCLAPLELAAGLLAAHAVVATRGAGGRVGTVVWSWTGHACGWVFGWHYLSLSVRHVFSQMFVSSMTDPCCHRFWGVGRFALPHGGTGASIYITERWSAVAHMLTTRTHVAMTSEHL